MRFPYLRRPCEPSEVYPVTSRYFPHILIKVLYGDQSTPEFYALVDSGADMTTFTYEIAEYLNVDPESGIPNDVRGVGAEHTTYVHEGFEVEVGGHRIPMRIAFLKEAPTALGILGREGLFENFKVVFDEKKKRVELKPHQS